MSILLPLQIEKGQLTQAKNPKEAIDAFIELLLTTPCQSCVADRQFGFIFNNLKFEIFNENEGVIYNSATEEEDVSVTMSYIKNLKKIHVNIEGTLLETNEAYKYTTSLNIWN